MADRVVVSYDELKKFKQGLEKVKQILDDFSGVEIDEVALGSMVVVDAYDSYVRRLKNASGKYSKKAGDFASMLGNLIDQFQKLDNQLGQQIEQGDGPQFGGR
ncbi:hypothetical protein J3T91_04330 [Bifidobacterium sp. B4001]|uniref:hypothetical protein n=1 Tax=unclassified Bifidobacterium TaxID=2608897 RepID=UPI00226B8ACD|nr:MULTISPECIES: hypothetical protein [unclassified Bifidobacterium]MCX8672741.1 hypothetical protein [Bifidobacterium sp. B4079]MCX8681174.1 hypothetical protein [Bifidobacterium sp. B4001]